MGPGQSPGGVQGEAPGNSENTLPKGVYNLTLSVDFPIQSLGIMKF